MNKGPRPEPQVVSLGRASTEGAQVEGHSTSMSESITNTITNHVATQFTTSGGLGAGRAELMECGQGPYAEAQRTG